MIIILTLIKNETLVTDILFNFIVSNFILILRFSWALKDLVETNDLLQSRLILELIHYQKDIETANVFLQIFGQEKHLKKLPESIREFYLKNIEIISTNVNNELKTSRSRSQSAEKYYYPHELLTQTQIKFLDKEEHLVEMIDYFKTKKPDIIGLDCEWKWVSILSF